MRIKKLPKPGGRYLVGSVLCELTDSSRASHILSEDQGRTIQVKIWYPVINNTTHNYQREQLWEQLNTERGIPFFLRLLLRSAQKISTNTYRYAIYANDIHEPRVLIYNHGMISFASENTMLMESLASHGYIIISLQHSEQWTEFNALRDKQSKAVKEEHIALQKEIQSTSGKNRDKVYQRYYQAATNTNTIVRARSADTEYAVNKIQRLLSLIPGFGTKSFSQRIGLAGLSLGGAVGTEYAKHNKNVDFIINIDGGMYGTLMEENISTPYLMLYSQKNSGTNDFLLKTKDSIDLVLNTIPETKHLNFHDIAAIYPALRWIKSIGTAKPMPVIDRRNQVILDFISEFWSFSA